MQPPNFTDTIRWLRWRGRMDDDSLSRVLDALAEADHLEQLGILDAARSSYGELFRFGLEAWSDPLQAMASAGAARVELKDHQPRAALEWLKLALGFGMVTADGEPAFRDWLASLRLDEARILVKAHPVTALYRVDALIGESDPGSPQYAELHQVRASAQLAKFDHESAARSADIAIGILEPGGPSDELRAAFELRCAAMLQRDPFEAEYAYIRAAETALEIARRYVEDPRYAEESAADIRLRSVRALRSAEAAVQRGALAVADRELNSVRSTALLQRDWSLMAAADYELARLYLATASGNRARLHAARARDVAASLGWAWLEGAAIVLLERVSLATGVSADESPVRSLSRARWLDSKRSPGEPSLCADGWLDRLEAVIAERCQAWTVAEAAFRRALDQVNQQDSMALMAHHAVALSRFLIARGRVAEAGELEQELTSGIAKLRQFLRGIGFEEPGPEDDSAAVPRQPQYPFARQLALAEEAVEQIAAERGLAQHRRMPSTLATLVSLCDRYEARLQEAHGVADLAELRAASAPPYAEAAEVALELDDVDRGFSLLERGKARTLLEQMARDVSEAGRPATLRRCQEMLAPGQAIAQFLVGPRALWCLSLTRNSADARRLCQTDTPQWQEFESAVSLGQSAAHLQHPVMRSISEAIGDLGSRNEVTTIIPHRCLHNTPLHLGIDLEPPPGVHVYAPSASIAIQAASSLTVAGRAVVIGDPLGDLPWARQEASLVATALGVNAYVGEQATLRLLESQLQASGPPVRVVHLACHAHFDPVRPERSGVHLAGGRSSADRWAEPWRRLDDDTLVATVTDLSRLRWQGALVVVNACDAGRHQIAAGDELHGITSTLLATGAAAILTSLWPVDDPSGALILTSMMRELAANRAWTTRAVYSSLAVAQSRYRQSAASGKLPDLRRELGFDRTEPPTPPSVPATDPWLWAPFVLVSGARQ